MRSNRQASLLDKRRRLRMDYLAGKVCEVCGGGDELLVTWRETPGPIHASKLWQVRQELREQYLPLTMVRCITCKNRKVGDMLRNDHGGGAQGIALCKCDVCKKARSTYNTEWQRRKRARLKALKALPKANGK